MPENWKTYKFEDLYDIASGLSKSRDQFGFGYPFVTFKDVFYNWFLPENLGDLANTNEKEQIKGGIIKGDIVLTRTSETLHELGMSSVALKDYPKSTFNGFCKRLRQKEESSLKIEPVFMAYFLRSKFFRNEISKYAAMTTRASLNIAAINSLSVTLPPDDEQKAIASILKPLDDKIENNLAMNKTLEDMAMVLYKHWFVDFGPFKEGKFIESELGKIPEGWEVNPISHFGNIICGKTPSKKKEENFTTQGGILFIKIPDMHGNVFVTETTDKLSEIGNSSQLKKLLPQGCINVSCIATVGLVTINPMPAHTNQQINSIVPKSKITTYFLYNTMITYKDRFLNEASGGSATLNMNTTTFSGIEILTPSNDVLSSFDTIVSPWFNLMLENQNQNQSLISLRDTLLPKLISGEVRLTEFEEKITAAL